MKVLALHLPQYHRTPDNDKWWGEGFTDWDNLKKSKPLFEGHEQPIEPLDDFYYDMTNVDTFKFQADLASKYNVFGFIYYHYWFDGKMLLEKPCEILLEHKEIKNNYCFCWANETWARTWDGHENDILIKQNYSGEKDWEKHINYLIPFFKDDRYIKKGNRPVMYFYSCCRIERFNEMIEYWNKKLSEIGFGNLFVVEFINSFNRGNHPINSDRMVQFEPLCTSKYYVSPFVKFKRLMAKKFNLIDFMSYDYVWKIIINNKHKYSKPLYRGAFVNFDNSPRKGKKALIMTNASPKTFKKYLLKLINEPKREYDDEYLVINAWNEWCEGAVLEPTKKNGYGYLEAIKDVIEGHC